MADQGSEGLLSPWLRSRRIAAAKPHLKGRTLDIGCGSGALSALVEPGRYIGVDIDDGSLELARRTYPQHEFRKHYPDEGELFDTVVSLAVIEHTKEPTLFLRELARYLKPEAKMVITTPHPSMDVVHDLGSSIGLFSRHANEEHEELLDRGKLQAAGERAGLEMVMYRRFLFGANSITVYKRVKEHDA